MKIIHTSGKRKNSVARATLRQGTGKVRVNGMLIDNYEPKMSRLKIREPLLLAGDAANKINISIRVSGGGVTSQADAARLAVAKALVAQSRSDKLEKQFLKYDRTLMVADVRRKETHKPNRHGKARSKVQKSYR